VGLLLLALGGMTSNQVRDAIGQANRAQQARCDRQPTLVTVSALQTLNHTTAMKESERLLFGPYKTPKCKIGDRLHCDVKGWVHVTGFSKGPIRWPLTFGGPSCYILCGDLVRAVRREANQAVAYWWGASTRTVSAWRRALGVALNTEGTRKLWSQYAAPRRGKPLPAGTRQKMSDTVKAKGTRPPWLNPPWSPEENALLGELPDAEVARLTGRTRSAVYAQRWRLRIPANNGDRRGRPMKQRKK
jgi:hypothetical protein